MSTIPAALRLHVLTAISEHAWRDCEDGHFRSWFNGQPDLAVYEGIPPPADVPASVLVSLALIDQLDLGYAKQLGCALRLRVAFPDDFAPSPLSELFSRMVEAGWREVRSVEGVRLWLGTHLREGSYLHHMVYLTMLDVQAMRMEPLEAPTEATRSLA